MTERGLRFGSVAEAYERFRRGYPDEVVERTLAYASRPIESAVEVGAGTGKATRAFAGRGVAVTATEPDPGMYAMLRQRASGLDVSPVLSTFEDFVSSARFDLLYAAAAWHWTDPAVRWQRSARLLEASGTVAFFGSPMKLADSEVRGVVEEARSPILPEDEVRPPGRKPDDGEMRWPGTELSESNLFTDVEQHVLPREVVVPAERYVGYLSTVSAYIQLTPDDRHEVLRRIRDVLPAEVRLDVSVTPHLARRG